MGWVGLGWFGLVWVWLDWVGLGWVELAGGAVAVVTTSVLLFFTYTLWSCAVSGRCGSHWITERPHGPVSHAPLISRPFEYFFRSYLKRSAHILNYIPNDFRTLKMVPLLATRLSGTEQPPCGRRVGDNLVGNNSVGDSLKGDSPRRVEV